MKIVFMGTPEFAIPSLQMLLRKHEVLAVITTPDKPAGRGHALQSSPIKTEALNHKIKVLQPKNLKSPKLIEFLKNLDSDIFVVVAFRMLPEIIWSLPKYGTLNLHASLLPKYRGAAPIQRAIMNGESVTGLTVFKLNSQIDTGEIISTCSISVGDNDTGGEIHDRMMQIGANLLLESLDKIESGAIKFIEQDDRQASLAPKIFREDCEIHWNRDVRIVYNHIRALIPYPCAWFRYSSQTYKIFKSRMRLENPSEAPGEIVLRNSSLLVACLNGYIDIQEIQANGKRKMLIAEFLNGSKLKGS